MKRIILISAIVIVVGAGLYLGRHYIFKSAEPVEPLVEPQVLATTPVDGTASPDDEAPDTLRALSGTPMLDYWTDISDRSTYGIGTDGIVYRIPAGGSAAAAIAAGSQNISAIFPAPQGASVLIETDYPQNPFFAIVSPVDKSRKFLPLGAVAAAWSPDAKSIVYLRNQTLNIFTLASGKSTFLTNLNMTDVLMAWKAPREIYIGSRPATGVPGQWWTYNLDKKTLTSLTDELPGLALSWSADGKTGLQFTNKADSQGNNLSLIKINGPAVSMRATSLPEKCTPPGAVMYCGELLGAAAGQLPDSYYQGRLGGDNIAKIATVGYPPEKIIYFGSDSDQAIDVYHPTVVGSSLYFINRSDSRLYSLPL